MTAGQPLAGKTAVVTGGAQGIGLRISEKLVADGAFVAILDVQAEKSKEFLDRVGGRRAMTILADVRSTPEIDSAVQAVAERQHAIDILVNSAYRWTTRSRLEDVSDTVWDDDLAMLLKSYFVVTRSAIPVMRSGGSIINLGSVHGLLATRLHGTYAISKAAVAQMTRVHALELGSRNIRVNVVAPGFISGPELDAIYEEDPDLAARHASVSALGRLGKAEEIADVVAFLASEGASFITGQTITVDGGMTAELQLSVAQDQWARLGLTS